MSSSQLPLVLQCDKPPSDGAASEADHTQDGLDNSSGEVEGSQAEGAASCGGSESVADATEPPMSAGSLAGAAAPAAESTMFKEVHEAAVDGYDDAVPPLPPAKACAAAEAATPPRAQVISVA